MLRRRNMLKTEQGVLPSGFTKCKYLESSGDGNTTQYTFTDLSFQWHFKATVEYEQTLANRNQAIFGQNTNWISVYNGLASDYNFYIGDNTLAKHSATLIRDGQTRTIICDGQSGTYTSSDTPPQYPFGIFCMSNSNNKTPYKGNGASVLSPVIFVGKIYSLTVYSDAEGTTLAGNFIPCLDGDGVPCFYDTVTGNCYYNMLSGHQFGYETENGTYVAPI